ncbi:anti-sigma factor family protein [Georgenia sp. AZ-5]|uniref:anti-sigma factor family protein n=1 Tax=Georgenia sp. AZ-5 TaxID=3367526 RepID=UPI0037548432
MDFWQHLRLRTWVEPYVDGELDASRSREVAEHLNDCRGCSGLAELQRLVRAAAAPPWPRRPGVIVGGTPAALRPAVRPALRAGVFAGLTTAGQLAASMPVSAGRGNYLPKRGTRPEPGVEAVRRQGGFPKCRAAQAREMEEES